MGKTFGLSVSAPLLLLTTSVESVTCMHSHKGPPSTHTHIQTGMRAHTHTHTQPM